jgi:4-hydroxybenzoate polyprenyltransferase
MLCVQDKRDDALVGVKSTALLFGDKTKAWASGFAVTNAAGMLLAGASAGCGLPYFAGVAAGSAHITWQIRSVDLHDGPDCMAKFVSNQWYGALIYAGVVLDRLMAVAL